MRRKTYGFIFGFAAILLTGPFSRGFTQDWEKALLSLPQADSCRAYLFRLTEEPHVAGTEEDFANAEFIRNKLQSFGLATAMATYDVYLPYPREVRLELTRPEHFEGPTPEQGFAVDKDAYASNIFPGFNAYSPSGSAEAQVVYVNYGRPEDYRQLAKLGISVKNKIALARYGKNFRGVKSRVAEEHGASGLIIYSDPADDGYMKGDIFPRGPYRPEFGVQRGSVQYLFVYPGDPLTPGYAATANARRIALEAVKNMPSLPTMPLSYGDARRILKNLAGPNVPKGWQGGLPFAYHTGPGPAEVRMQLDMDYQVRPIWDIIAKIPGSVYPEQMVVIGNHHDAWTYGAVDPSSGTAVLLELARSFAELQKMGYRPQRTIVFALWDGEEYGLIGSTEWVEEHRSRLMQHCVAYINIDVAVSGNRFSASASPALKPLIQKILRKVDDPTTHRSLFRQTWLNQNENKKKPAPAADSADSLALKFGNLGSGSDFTAFFDFAGIPSLSMSFGGPYGVYHATYDDFYWMSHFGDPNFSYHATMVKVAGMLLLQYADADILPFSFANYAREMLEHARKMEKAFREQGAPQELSMAGIIEKCQRWLAQAKELPDWDRISRELDPNALNSLILKFDRIFLDEKGLPGRPWFKHQLFAPGYYTGYASQPYPGIKYYLDRQDWAKASVAVSKVEALLEKAIQLTHQLAETVKPFKL
ncbi:MAG: M28 family peptidase, partial [Calditrichaeota bacterium]